MRAHELILVFHKHPPTYNEQVTEGQPYKITRKITKNANYGLVCKRRPYVIAADGASLSQAQIIVRDLERRSTTQITEQFSWDTSSRRKQ